ncbi:MAG: hypothetical protein K8U03_03045 [Planctomycetia bacterium]|nr:hypothetical protein [Planctomycetia bacterium]
MDEAWEGNLTSEVLADPALFGAWIVRERGYRKGLVRSDDDEEFALAAREKALTDPTVNNPIGWLKSKLDLKAKNPQRRRVASIKLTKTQRDVHDLQTPRDKDPSHTRMTTSRCLSVRFSQHPTTHDELFGATK